MGQRPLLFVRDSWKLAQVWATAAAEAVPELDPVTALEADDYDRVEAALVWKPKVGFLAGLPNLRLVVSVGAGVDHIVEHDTAYPRHVPLIRMVDPGLTQGMIDYAAWACLSVLRNAPHYARKQAEAQWDQMPMETADAKTVAVLGLGQIGLPVASALTGLGFRVIGWSHSPKSIDGLQTLCGAETLGEALGQADMVVNLLPATAHTKNLFAAETFAAMRPGAAFINAGRGATVDEAALLAALDSRHIGAAYLDVFATEPLPADHEFWVHERVVITPHNASITHPSSGIRALRRALDEMAEGTPLSNRVDWERGY